MKLQNYLDILNYIKKYGTEDLEKIIIYYQKNFGSETKSSLIQKQLLNEQVSRNMYEKNKKIINYLKEINLNIPIFEPEFINFIYEIKQNLSKIDIYLDNIMLLKELEINNINLYDKKNYFLFDIRSDEEIINSYKINNKWYYIKETVPKNIRKIYTDGEISFSNKNVFGEGTIESPYFIYGGYYNTYSVDVLKNNWVLEINNQNNIIKSNMYLKESFNFDKNRIPTKEEINSLQIPDSIRKYHKNLILRKSK